MRTGRNSIVELGSPPTTWDEQTIADVLEAWDDELWSRLARAIQADPSGQLAVRTAACARRCDVTGNGNVWLLLMRRLGVDSCLTTLPERRQEQHWP